MLVMKKIKNNKILWLLGPVASAVLGVYMFFRGGCCGDARLEFLLAFGVGVLVFVLSVVLLIKRILSVSAYFRDPAISRPRSVFEDRKDNNAGS